MKTLDRFKACFTRTGLTGFMAVALAITGVIFVEQQMSTPASVVVKTTPAFEVSSSTEYNPTGWKVEGSPLEKSSGLSGKVENNPLSKDSGLGVGTL